MKICADGCAMGRAVRLLFRVLMCLLVCSSSLYGEEPSKAERLPGEILKRSGSVTLGGLELATDVVRLPVDKHCELQTGADGQLWFIGPAGEELRLRERTHLVYVPDAKTWQLKSGMCGCWRKTIPPSGGADSVKVMFPQGECEIQKGIVVVKVHPVLTRVAAVKGTHQLTGPEETKLVLNEKQERAVAWKQTSQGYLVTDDCYFAWYWK